VQPVLQHAEPDPYTGDAQVAQNLTFQFYDNQEFLIDGDIPVATETWSPDGNMNHGTTLSVFGKELITMSPGTPTGPMHVEPVALHLDSSEFDTPNNLGSIPGCDTGYQSFQPWSASGVEEINFSLSQDDGGNDNAAGLFRYRGRPILPNSLAPAISETRTVFRPVSTNKRG